MFRCMMRECDSVCNVDNRVAQTYQQHEHTEQTKQNTEKTEK